MPKYETYYVVGVRADGSLVTHTELPLDGLESKRQANVGDIIETSRQLVREIEMQDFIGRIVAALNPVEPTVADRMRAAMKAHGVEPTSEEPGLW